MFLCPTLFTQTLNPKTLNRVLTPEPWKRLRSGDCYLCDLDPRSHAGKGCNNDRFWQPAQELVVKSTVQYSRGSGERFPVHQPHLLFTQPEWRTVGTNLHRWVELWT